MYSNLMALYIVATPIGNLKDITLRALEVLKCVDVIAAEDTRITRKLLSHFGIQKPLLAYHEHSRPGDLARLVRLLEDGKHIAYVVDAGTPGISDPGSYLVRRVSDTLPNVPVIPIPGPSALAAAVSIAALEKDEFLFLGFPPHKKGRKSFFNRVKETDYPVVLYESPYRLLRTLKDLADAGLGARRVILVKEVTKIHEEIIRSTVDELVREIAGRERVKGEYVLIINR